MRVVVTGGAGFIGSCVVRTLNDAGIFDIIIVDDIRDTEKWMNMRNKRYITYINKDDFLSYLPTIEGITHIIHMGAQSSTTERNFDYLWQNNFIYTQTLWNYCAEKQISFIYASSAATYGDGSQGFDDYMDIDLLRPLNAYGYSKQVFDQWVQHQAMDALKQHVGLKFFNVYGPNEYYKGIMASMVFHGYNQLINTGEIKLFKSTTPQYEDGGQLRDFIYIKDVCSVILWFLQHPEKNGLYNVGTGKAQSFRVLAESVFTALGLEPNIVYIDMPQHLRDKYQSYTQAEIGKLRTVGYSQAFIDVEEGVYNYVRCFLAKRYSTF